MAGIGEALRSTRERRGLSIDQVAQDTRISPRFLEALEAEQFQELPAPVYVRGFLRSYANYLHLEPQELLDQLVGGSAVAPGARESYIGSIGRNGHSSRRRNDPFRRGGVVAPPPPPAVSKTRPAPTAPDDSWAPEPLAPFAPPHEDHGYIPGSDLMEAPEYEPSEEYQYPEPEARFERRTAGVLAERPPSAGEPGIPRRVLVFGAAVVGVLGVLALAVVLTRDDDGGNNRAAASGGATPGVTPGTVIAVGSPTATAPAVVSPSASASAPAEVSPSTTAGAGTATAPTSTGGGGLATATSTPSGTATPVSTSTPTPFPTPTPFATPTVQVIRAESNGFGECAATGTGSFDCGAPPYRVICYAPIGFPQNQNWWVDVDRSFGALPAGWKEYDGLASNGAIINAGQTLCATP